MAASGTLPQSRHLGYHGTMANGLTYIRRTNSVEATKQLAATLAPYVHPGDVIVLEGDLGAGKTHFTHGFAAALDIQTPVTSPTFNILLSYYHGRVPLHHLDLYRLDDATQLEDIGYYELIDGDSDGVAFVEWAEKFPESLPCDYLEVVIRRDPADENARQVRVHSFGPRSRQLLCVWARDSKSRLQKTA